MTEPIAKCEKWREDFPVESERDDHITRRDFTRFLLLISAGFAAGNGMIWAKALMNSQPVHEQLELGGVADLKPGEWKAFNYPTAKHPAILIHRLNGEYVAFSQKCTHLACPVAYARGDEKREERIECHCHRGEFDINTGKGTAGPPRELRPLPRIELKIENDRIYAVGVSHGGKHA